MLRSSFLVFVAGWVAWFWIDKPRGGQFSLPQTSDSPVDNFQRAFDILKAGHPELAYLFIWNAHYLILSLLGGALLALAYNSVSTHLARRRMRRHLIPPTPASRDATGRDDTSGPESAPTEK